MFRSINRALLFLIPALMLTISGCDGPVDLAVEKAVHEMSEIERRIGGNPHTLSTDRVGHYGYGRAPTEEEITGWDIDVRPDGVGLPDGRGSVVEGEEIYQSKCAHCHGDFGEGIDRWPQLAGGIGTLTEERPERTVGSYWPYTSTLWDYINRAMPFQQPQSLRKDEVYSLTAYVLYLNDLVEEDFEVDQDNLAGIEMPNRDGFYEDPRPDSVNELCSNGCRDPASIKITSEASTLALTSTVHIQNGGGDDINIASPVSGSRGKNTYDAACAICHGSGLAGAPIPGNGESGWSTRLQQGRDILLEHVIEGFTGDSGVMPPKGGQLQLLDEDVAAAMDYMLDQAGTN